MVKIDAKKGKNIAIFYMMVYFVLIVLTCIFFSFRYKVESYFPAQLGGYTAYSVLIFLGNSIQYSVEIGMALRLFTSFHEGKRYLYRCWRNFQIGYCVFVAITGTLQFVLVWNNYNLTEFEIFFFEPLETHFSIVTVKRIILAVYVIDILVACPLGILLIETLFDEYDQERQSLEPLQGLPQQGMAAPDGGYMTNGYPSYSPQEGYVPAPGNNSAPGPVPLDDNQKGNIPT